MVNEPIPPAPAWRRLAPLALLVAGLAGAYAFGLHRQLTIAALGDSRATLQALVAAHPVAAAAAFMALYTAIVALSVPAASALSVFAGFLFGWPEAMALVAVSATLGATLVFLAARSAFGDSLRRRAGGVAARLAAGFERDAFTVLLALRMAPFVPFFLVNIVPALFRVPVRTFVLATALGILPGTFAYCSLGEGVDSVLAAAAAAGRAPTLADLVTPQITLAFAALAIVALLPVVIRQLWPRAVPGA